MSELPIVSKKITVVTESSSLDYPRAPVHTLPKKEFNCIEYPGYIDNVDKIWETLGGWRRIENCFNETGSLELRYRPTDPFSHPIHGDVIKTANLVVKIRRRRKIRRKPNADPNAMSVDYDADMPNNHPWEMKAEVLGYCMKTCRHRGIADFQWLCDPNDPIVSLRKNMTNLDMEGIKAFKFDTNDTDLDNLRNFPPPMFSRLEWPLNYAYRQNPAVVRVAIQNAEGEMTVKLVNRSKTGYIEIQSIEFESTEIPTEPLPIMAKYIKSVPEGSIERIKKLFDERPVWTRTACMYNLPPKDRKYMKKLLPFVSYYMSTGPWKLAWVRFGFDPKQHKDCRFYQTLDARNMNKVRPLSRAKRRGVVNDGILNIPTEADNNQGDDTRKYIFDGVSEKSVDSAIFQLCDLVDPILKELVDTTEYLRDACHPVDGWYYKGIILLLRARIRARRRAIVNKTSYEPPPEDLEPIVMDIENEPSTPDTRRSHKEKTKARENASIKNKVEEFMKNLQSIQPGLIETAETEPSSISESFPSGYANVFGDDDDEDRGDMGIDEDEFDEILNSGVVVDEIEDNNENDDSDDDDEEEYF